MKKKKKGELIKSNIKNYYETLFTQKIKFLKIANINTYRLAYLMNMNKQFTNIANLIEKHKLLYNNQLLPSIVREYSTDIAIKPFWNARIQNLSDKLYLPSFDNLYESDIRDNTFSSDSWFNIENYVNPEEPYRLKTKAIDISVNDIIKTKQIKLFLNMEQKKYMEKIIGTYRYYYNRCVSFINNYSKNTKTSWYLVNPSDINTKIIIDVNGNPYNFINMRKTLKENSPTWLLPNFPVHLIDKALKECFDRFKACLDKFRKTRKPFSFSYKSKKEIYQTINLEEQMIIPKSNGFFSRWKIQGSYVFKTIKTHDRFEDYKIQDSSITYHRILKTFVLNLTHTVQSFSTNNDDVCAIDQGIRTPFTVYSTNEVMKMGKNSHRKIMKICKEIDIIQSRINRKSYYTKDKYGIKTVYKVTSERRRNLRKALHKKIQYIKNLRTELHNKCIRYLCNTYSTIILPPFKTQEMVGNLRTETARSMYTFGFYQFKMKLKNKAKEYNINVVEKREPFTSKTCGRCGTIKHNLGTSEEYRCNKCGLHIDRDINGARCILLRNIKYV